MRVLVTGICGFAGRHLAVELRTAGYEVIGFDREPEKPSFEVRNYLSGDISDADHIYRALEETKPDACIHLAGVAFVPQGWTAPEYVFSVNTLGAIKLLEAVRNVLPSMRLIVVTSAEIYGQVFDDRCVSEDDQPHPESLYAVSKLSTDLMALLYAARYNLHIVTARPANHIGPGQSPRFATSSFARQLADIRAGRRPPILHVGNLDSERSFLDVRDTVRAYRLLLEKGVPGKAYNIAAPDRIRVGQMLDLLCQEADLSPERRVMSELYRPTDRSPRLDTRRIREDTGWQPLIPLRQTLRDILCDWDRRALDEGTGEFATP